MARDKVESAFESFLQRLTPSQTLFTMARDMFQEIWDRRSAQAPRNREDLQRQIDEIAG
ncbi:MAG: hypothetical protein AAGK02_16145 [Pseudomonadota bacterium]